ncbi:hypothetical protein [Comamonas guangdongensis]
MNFLIKSGFYNPLHLRISHIGHTNLQTKPWRASPLFRVSRACCTVFAEEN